MDRKKAIIAAATVAGSLLAASSAYALTSGIVDNGGHDGAGDMSPVVDVAPTDASTTTLAPATTGGTSDPAGRSGDDEHGTVGETTPQAGDDHGDEVEHRSDDDEHEDGVEPHEIEGHDDDD
jgi:hypothetical protein